MIVTTADELRATIADGLAVMKPYQRRALGIEPDQAREWLVEDLVRRIAERTALATGAGHGA